MKRPGWTRLSDPKACTCYGRWLHNASGWLVEHCGHPTALWPYLVVRPGKDPIIAPNGHAFRTLQIAMAAVEANYVDPPAMQVVFDQIGQRYCQLPPPAFRIHP